MKCSTPTASMQYPSVFVRITSKLVVRGECGVYDASPRTEESKIATSCWRSVLNKSGYKYPRNLVMAEREGRMYVQACWYLNCSVSRYSWTICCAVATDTVYASAGDG